MTAQRPHHQQSTGRIFAWPLAIAMASLVGLVAALVGDGVYDMLSWLLLGGTIALIARHLLR